LACAAFALLAAGGRPVRAADAKAEAAAKQAMAGALKDHAAGDDDGAVLRLQKARKACGAKCGKPTRAALLRSLGAVQFMRGDKAKASATFGEALDLAADLPWDAAIDNPDVVAEWEAVKAERAALKETPPKGDFDHVPEFEQAVDTPLPIYAELDVPGVAKVVVKYKLPGDTEFKHRTLPRFGGGYGGTIPCQDIKRGLLRYFLQAFDSHGEPLANSGDVKHLYFVPIRWSISRDPPHLPGQGPPEACNGKPSGAEEPAEGQPSTVGVTEEGSRFVRLWIGVAGSLDVDMMPSGSGVCALNSALAPVTGGFYCTNPDGSDFPPRTANPPQNETLNPSHNGMSPAGINTGDVRLLVTVAYATSSHFMTGVRAGYVSQSYPGAAASNDGKGISTPLHVELRETYLIGRDPLAHAGFAPYVFVSAGYGKFDENIRTSVQVENVVGWKPEVVWKLGGPYFGAAGVGVRYAFSPRVAFLTDVRGTLPFGPAGVLPSIAPEVELQYGF
jgi:hypothetical protein